MTHPRCPTCGLPLDSDAGNPEGCNPLRNPDHWDSNEQPEVRAYENEDARRELAVSMMQHHVRAAGIDADYDADLEYMDAALVAFADEWARRDLAVPKQGEAQC